MNWPCPKCEAEVTEQDNYCPSCGFELRNAKHKSQPSIVSNAEEYRSYIQILGIVEVVFGIFALVASLPIFFIFNLFPFFGSGMTTQYTTIALIILILVTVLLIVYGVFAITIGIQLLRYKRSGRIGTMIIGAISLIFMPLGTAFGLATLYVLTRPEVEMLFS